MPRCALPALALLPLALLIPLCAGHAAAAGPDRAPDILLLRPLNGSTVNTTTVELGWTGLDPDGDALAFVLELADNAGFNLTRRTGGRNLTLELPDRAAFSWRVTASDGGNNVTSPYSTFKVRINRPPVIHSVPVLDATVGRAYVYQVVATDPDPATLSYRLVEGPGNMGVTPDGKVLWVPWSGQAGKAFRVEIIVSDGEFEEKQEFTVGVPKAQARTAAAEPGPGIAAAEAAVLAVAAAALWVLRRRDRGRG